MTQADRIRRYALAHHVDPERSAGRAELTIRAGDVCRAMGLHGRVPNICSALGSRAFLDMAGLRLLDRTGPRQSTTTTFRYALVEQRTDVDSASAASPRPADPNPDVVRTAGPARRARAANVNPTIVIQCAGTKSASAGYLTLRSGRRVRFVVDPRAVSKSRSLSYKHPDDAAPSGLSWRQVLCEYNRAPAENPLGLLPAWRLYEPPADPSIYSDLVEAYGLDNVFILSAGWGLVRAGFLLPDYDITFAASAKSCKRRRKRDRFEDFAMLPTTARSPILFLGGKDYVPSFCDLTRNVENRRIVFHYSREAPRAMNCELRRFTDGPPRTWFYHCARALIRGEIEV